MEHHGLYGLRPPSDQRDCGLRTGKPKTSPDHRTSLELGERRLCELLEGSRRVHLRGPVQHRERIIGLPNEFPEVRNRLRRNSASNRMEWVTACRNVQTLIRDSKEAKWREFISSADLSSNPNKIWTTVKALSGKSPSSIRNESLWQVIHDWQGEGKRFYAEVRLNHPPAHPQNRSHSPSAA